MYLDLDETSITKVDFLRASLPMQTINHISLDSLLYRPIALSYEFPKGCEFKKLDPGNDAITAKLQMGLWHAA